MLHIDHSGHNCIQEPYWIWIYGNAKEHHKPQSLQAWSSTKKTWTRQCNHRESNPASKPCQSHNKFDPTASNNNHHRQIFNKHLKPYPKNNRLWESMNQCTSWNMQSSIQYDWAEPDKSLVLAPQGKAEGKWCKIEPLRTLLTVVPLDETTMHRFPAGLANTYLEIKVKIASINKKWKT